MIRIGTRTGTDATDVLIAGSGEVQFPAATTRTEDRPKHFWLELNGTSGVQWPLDVARSGEYTIEVALRAPESRLSVMVDGVVVRSVDCHGQDWDIVSVGEIELPAGPCVFGLQLVSAAGDQGEFAIRSVELSHRDEKGDLLRRLTEYRSASEPELQLLKKSPYGIMVQYGPWSYPRTGYHKLDLDAHVESFDVNRFVEQVADTGAGHVIWSLTWWTFQLSAPSSAVDRVVGHPRLTSRRDLVGEVAKALQARGIMFFLYYHPGHEAHLGYESTEWWRAQRWPEQFTHTGRGDRVAASYHATAVFAELGLRYGELLNGWFLDDGMLYYPAPFERLGRELRAGHPGRLISYNSWIMPRVSQFSDIEFGEGCRDLGGLDLDEAGVHRSGKSAGLLAHAMTPLQAEWGVHQANQWQQLDVWATDGLDTLLDQAREAGNVPVTIDLLMWYPGVFDPAALNRLHQLRGPSKEQTE